MWSGSSEDGMPAFPRERWGGRWDSNPRRPDPQSGALPTELRPPRLMCAVPAPALPAAQSHSADGAPGRTRTCNHRLRRPMLYPVELQAHRGANNDSGGLFGAVVGVNGFEPLTFCSQSRRATRLRHTPPPCRASTRHDNTGGEIRRLWRVRRRRRCCGLPATNPKESACGGRTAPPPGGPCANGRARRG